MKDKLYRRKTRHFRIRNKIKGTSKIPRLSVFRSNRHVYAQIIDDDLAKTICAASDLDFENKDKKILEDDKVKIAYEVGKSVAKMARSKKIKKVIFDRGGFKYHGRIKALADGARKEGLIF